jgi:MFS family permease
LPDPAPAARGSALAIAPGVMMAGIAGGLAFPILPSVGLKAGLSLGFIGLILAANRIARVAANPWVGALTDRIGGKRTLMAGLALQVAVIALYVVGVRSGHPGAYFLIGRLLHGPGSACVFVAGQALALEAGGPGRGGRAGGTVRAAIAVGVPVGLVLGAVFSDRWGETATLLAAGAALLGATAAAGLLAPDLRVHVAQRPALLDALRAALDRRLAILGSLNLAATFAGSGMVLTTLVMLVHARGIALGRLPERTVAGVFMGGLVVMEALCMPFLGRLGDARARHADIAATGLALVVPGLALIGLAQTATALALGIAVLGLGTGGLGPSVLALVGRFVRPEERGLALGLLAVAGDLGGAIGPLWGTAVFAQSASAPYLSGALLVACFLPGAVALARQERPAR